MATKLYPALYPGDLEPHYSRHAAAMTAEGLHGKGAIAEQLAWRDKELLAATRERDELRKSSLHNLNVAEDRRATVDRQVGIITGLRADLLATRRALRLAQARAMHNLANTKAADALTGYFVPGRCFRMARLATYWAKKFERMAADCGEEMG